MLGHGIVAVLSLLAQAPDPGLAGRVDRTVERYRKDREVPGIAVAVVRNGHVIKATGYGLANVELKAPVTPRTLFGLGSISKQFTATAIMLLAEEGKLSVDDPITRYVDSLPPHWSRLTLRRLLTHTSGIPEEHWLPTFVEFDRFEHDQLSVLRTIFADSLESAPGARWAYRNSAFRLLGMVIERVSGQSYWTFLERRIFHPLGMIATRSSDPKTLIPNRAKGYGRDDGRIVNRDAVTESAAFSEGALMSSVLDLARWDSALYHPSIPSAASLEQMWTPVRLNDGTTYPYGFGWALDSTNGIRTVGHSGSLPGFVTNISRFVGKRLTVIVLTNSEWANPRAVAEAIGGIYEPALIRRFQPIADADPDFTALVRGVVERGEIDPARVAPQAKADFDAREMKQLSGIFLRLGRLATFEPVERTDRPSGRRYRFRGQFERGTMIFTALADGQGRLSQFDFQEQVEPAP